MDRWRSTRSLFATLDRCAAPALLLAVSATTAACAGTGPAIVEHPRSASMMLVSPERDPLAGAITLPTSGMQAAPDPAPEPALTLPTPPPLAPAGASRVALETDAYSLALGSGETSALVPPPVALSTALAASAGPAPHLRRDGPSLVAVSVSETAVEEGAWEEARRP